MIRRQNSDSEIVIVRAPKLSKISGNARFYKGFHHFRCHFRDPSRASPGAFSGPAGLREGGGVLGGAVLPKVH